MDAEATAIIVTIIIGILGIIAYVSGFFRWLYYQVKKLFSRVTKIPDKELEVLHTSWQKMQDALGRVSGIVSPVKSYMELNRMTDQEIREFSKASKLNTNEKEQLLKAEDKTQFYKETIFWHELKDAKNYLNDFHNYVLYNKIFFSSELFSQFNEMDDLLQRALIDAEISKRSQDHRPIVNAYNEVKGKADLIVEKIERLIKKRLR